MPIVLASSTCEFSYSRDVFIGLKQQSHDALLPAHLFNTDYLTADGKFAPDKYVEGIWKNEKNKKSTLRPDIPDAFQNGSALSPQRRGFSGGCKEVITNETESNLRRRALNNNLSLAPQKQRKNQQPPGSSRVGNNSGINTGTSYSNQKKGPNSRGGISSNTGYNNRDAFEKPEVLPEWMEDGPTDNAEVIHLGGFDEHEQHHEQQQTKRQFSITQLMNQQKKKNAADKQMLPSSDVEFAAQFGLLDSAPIDSKRGLKLEEEPKASRLSRFFGDKPRFEDEQLPETPPEKAQPKEQVLPAVALLLSGGSKSMGAMNGVNKERNSTPTSAFDLNSMAGALPDSAPLNEKDLMDIFSKPSIGEEDNYHHGRQLNPADTRDGIDDFAKKIMDGFSSSEQPLMQHPQPDPLLVIPRSPIPSDMQSFYQHQMPHFMAGNPNPSYPQHQQHQQQFPPGFLQHHHQQQMAAAGYESAPPPSFPMMHPAAIQAAMDPNHPMRSFLSQFQAQMMNGGIGSLDPSDPMHAQFLHMLKQQQMQQNFGQQQVPMHHGMNPSPTPSQQQQIHQQLLLNQAQRQRNNFDLVPTAVMLQRSGVKDDVENDFKAPIHETTSSTTSTPSLQSTIPGQSTSVFDDLPGSPMCAGGPGLSQIQAQAQGAQPPPVVPGIAQLGSHVFPIPSPFAAFPSVSAFALDSKHLAEAHQRGDLQTVSFLQSRIQAQMQAFAALQQFRDAVSVATPHDPPRFDHQMSQFIQQQKRLDSSLEKRDSIPSNASGTPIDQLMENNGQRRQSMDHYQQGLNSNIQYHNNNGHNSGFPPHLADFNELGASSCAASSSRPPLSILNKLPPSARPLTVEELERQLAGSP